MPRTKQPHTPPMQNEATLDSCILTFVPSKTSGITSSHQGLSSKDFSQLKADIAKCGGSFSGSVAACTHLVATQDQFDKKGAKIKAATDAGIFIVSFDWLVDCLNFAPDIDEANYLLTGITSVAADLDDTTSAIDTVATSVLASVPPVAQATGKQVKRARSSSDDEEAAPATKLKSTVLDNMKLSASSTKQVPVDDFYMQERNKSETSDKACRVYQSDGIIYDATLNQTESGKNANKFYRLQLLQYGNGTYFTWTRWGRVGANGQYKLLGNGDIHSAVAEFESKFKDKTGNRWEERDKFAAKSKKYVLLEINYESSEAEDELQGAGGRRASKESIASSASSVAESKLPKAVSRLMAFIFDQDYFDQSLRALNYDQKKMPLGKLSKKTLLQGYSVLKELAGLFGTPGNVNAIQELSDRYFSLIPRDFGRDDSGRLLRPPVLSASDGIKKEAEVLESLTDMQLTDDIMKAAKGKDRAEKLALADRQFQGSGLEEMTPLDPASAEYKELAAYLVKSTGQSHYSINYNIQDIFRLERAEDTDRFNNSEYSKLDESKSDRALLWHGSRSTNFGGILSQGLRIAPPEAPASGYMFGRGVYLANMSTKSANYCFSHASGQQGLLLLCEAELGKPSLKLEDADYNADERALAAGCISTWGVGLTRPEAWKDAECVHGSLKGVKMPDVSMPFGPSGEENAFLQYDEFICYNVAQVKLRYLIRTGM